MGLYRDEAGLVFEADDRFASSMGYAPVTPAEESDIYAQRGLEARGEERGALGAAWTGASRFASGATLGLSDMALSQFMTDAERQQTAAEIDAHPYIGAAGEMAGALATGIAAPGSALAKTPSGYLSSVAAHGVESGLARGGVGGYARAMTAMGAEGAVQSAGQYIGHSALADKEVTAEGLAGALGTGYAFGAIGGGAALGVVKGTVAARRLFARTMDAQAAKVAESSWTLARQEALDAAEANALTAQTRADEINAAKMEALRYRNEARATSREHAARPRSAAGEAAAPVDEAFVGPEPLIDVDGIPVRKSEGLTQAYRAPDPIEFNPADAHAFEGEGFAPGELMSPAVGDGQTGMFKRPVAGAAEPATALEQQLAGTKAKLDEGVALKDVKQSHLDPDTGLWTGDPIAHGYSKRGSGAREGGAYPPEMELSLDEKVAYDAMPRDPKALAERLKPGEIPPAKRTTGAYNQYAEIEAGRLRQNNPVPPQYGPTSRAPFSNLRSEIGKLGKAAETLGEIRQARTADLLGPAIAKKEAQLLEALDEQKAALEEFKNHAGFGDISDGIPTARGRGGLSAAEDAAALLPPRGASTGRHSPRALAMLDDMHEEALLVARTSDDPREVGAALQRADEAETLMERLSGGDAVSSGVPRFVDDVEHASRVFDRLERANAKVVDALGDAAHPASVARAKAWKQAEDEAVRKVTDRAARAVDDVEFGPRTPRQNLVDAQRNLDEVSVQDQEARRALGKAEKDAKGQRKARKDAERLDAKAAKAAATGSGVTTGLGVLEILDLPGMPKPSDLPVVGPLLGAWLKYKTISAAMGRKMGRVAANADSRVAVAAARTRDRVAKAVDRSMGAVERGARATAKHGPKLAGVLAARIYDDGQPDAKKGAHITEVAAVRIRELANYVATPGAIERDVRRELAGVADPDIIEAAEKHRRVLMEYLLKSAPKGPEQGMMQTIRWAPSAAQAMSFARRWSATSDPAGALERIAAGNDVATAEISETLRTVYPQILAQAQGRLLERLTNEPTNIPYRMRLQLSMLYQLPLDSALDPANLKISQSVYERKPMTPPPGAPGAPMPSVAQPTNLTALFQNPIDQTR